MDVSICVCDVYVYRVEFTVLNIFVNDVHLSANHDVVLRLVIDVLLLEVICVPNWILGRNSLRKRLDWSFWSGFELTNRKLTANR